jgi:iron complex outermembrane recepter protein
MFPVTPRARRLWLASAATLAFLSPALGQSGSTLPTITVEAERQTSGNGGSLTVPTAQQALNEIQRTAGGVAIVRADDYKTTTPATTLKDVLDYVPGVFVQPKWSEDSRLSIRGSGLASLGGAINFVTPSGRDAPLAAFSLDLGSFGFARTQSQTAGANGPWDGFITASAQRADGFRDHSDGAAAASSATGSRRTSRRAFTSTATMCGSAFQAR